MWRWFLGSRTVDDAIEAGNFSAALEMVDKALQLQPSDPALFELKGRILAKCGRSDEAGALFVQTADYFAGRGFGVKAISLLKRAQQLSPPPPGLDERIRDMAALTHLDDVSASPLFGMFSRDELVTVVRRLRPGSYEPGEILLVQGKPGNSLYVIASGEVRIFVRNADGWPEQVAKIGAPAFFGEIAVLEGGTRTATVTAASPVEVLELTKADLHAIAENHPRVREVIRQFAGQRQAELEQRGF